MAGTSGSLDDERGIKILAQDALEPLPPMATAGDGLNSKINLHGDSYSVRCAMGFLLP